MTDKRLLLALPFLALLAACGEDAPVDDGRAASGEVLKGTISDEMLPVDRVRSEPPLEDPEAFAKATSGPGRAAAGDDAADGEDGEGSGEPAPEVTQPPTPEVTPAE